MRHPPIMVPKGRLQICCKFCQVSASCHSSAMTPNNTADAPKTIRPHNAVFIRKKQRCRCLRPVAQARSFPLTPEEICARLESLHRMRDQVKLVKLRTGRLKEVSRKTSRGAIEDGGEFCQCDGCRLVERSGRAAAQDYLLGRVLRLFFFLQVPQFNFLARRSGRYQGGSLPAPLSYLFLGLKRRRVVYLKHGRILDLALRKRDRLQTERRNLSRGWQRTLRCAPDRHKAQGNLMPRIEIKQVVHLGVHEPEHDLGRQSRSRRNGQHIRQQGAAIPTEMAIGARLVLPGVPPVDPGTEDCRGRTSYRGFHRRRLNQVPTKITLSQEP